MVNLREGEFIEYTAENYQVYAQKDLKFKRLNQPNEIWKTGDQIPTKPVYSKLRAEDVELLPEYEYFMEQEIYAQSETTGKLIKLFQGGSNTGKRMLALMDKEGVRDFLQEQVKQFLDAHLPEERQKVFYDLLNSETFSISLIRFASTYKEFFECCRKEDLIKSTSSPEKKNLFLEMSNNVYDLKKISLAKTIDSIAEEMNVKDFNDSIEDFLLLAKNTILNSRNAYSIACGTSFHATKIAALFFNTIAGMEIIPILPGDFRGEYSNCIKDNDLIIGVSQSGETKDLIDILNDIEPRI